MRRINPHPLWLGHAGDARDLRRVLSAGVAALIDLALDEPPPSLTREVVYCRFPLLDGAGNEPWLLRCAVTTTATLLAARTPTLVFCGHGMSRSPVIAAAGLAAAFGRDPDACLAEVLRGGAADVTPALWREVKAVLHAGSTPGDGHEGRG
jgi:hypothetical protein